MGLSADQYAALLEPLHPGRVQQVQGQAHLEAWDIRRHLLRIFGIGGWEFQVRSCDLVHQWTGACKNKSGKEYTGHTVVYRVLGRLVIKDKAGRRVSYYDDGATGDAVNQPSLGDAHDLALKSAMSQALKRCAVNLGDQFGLSLYNGGKVDPVVVRSLATPGPAAQAQPDAAKGVKTAIRELAESCGWDLNKVAVVFAETHDGQSLRDCVDVDVLNAYLAELQADAAAENDQPKDGVQ